jgi:hypothetical protein
MTTTVTFAFKSPDDAPLSGVQIVATLSSYIVNGGVVLPAEVLDVSDADGLAVMDLHPNTGAAEGTTYTFKLTIPGVVRPSYFRRISVPDQDTISFEELMGGEAGSTTNLTTWDDALIWDDVLIWTEASAPPLDYWIDTATWNDSAIWTE